MARTDPDAPREGQVRGDGSGAQTFVPPDFKALFEQSPGLFMILDENLHIVAATDAYLKATKRSRSDIGRYVFDVFPDNPDDPKSDAVVNSTASFNRVLRSGVTDAMVVQRHDIRRPDSEGGGFEARYWSPVNSPIFRPDGTVGYVLHRVEDVTELVRLKQEGVDRAKVNDELRDRELRMEADLYARSREVAQSSLRLKEANAELERLYDTKRLQSEALLRTSEERFRTTVASIGDAVLTTDQGGKVTYLNPVAETMTGWTQHEAVSRPLQEVFPIINEYTREPAENPVSRVLREGQVVGLANHTVLISRDGREIAIDDSAAPIRDTEGRVTGVVLVFHDVTEKRKAEEALRASEERFRVAQELSPDGFTILRPVRDSLGQVVDFTWVYENQAIGHLNGTDPDEVVGKRLSEVMPGHATSPFHELYKRVVESGKQDVMEGKYEGDTIEVPTWFRVAVVPMNGDIAVLAQDITERKRAEEALRASEERFRSVVDNMSEGLMLFDTEGNLIYQNPASLRIHGFRREEDGRIDHENLPITWKAWDDSGRAITFDEWPVSRVFRHERFQDQVLYVVRVETGYEFFGSYNGSPVYDANGRFALGFITIKDISERKRAEEALREHARKLEETNKELEGFAYTISHDLRAPLRAMNAYSIMLQDELSSILDDDAKRKLEAIETNAIKMGQLVDDLLAFSRAGRTAMNISMIDMNKLLGEVLETMKFDGTGQLGVRVAPLPPAHGDPVLIQQVVTNLLSNAVKFSKIRKEPSIEIGGSQEDGSSVYYIKDNGVGFDMRFYDQLFGVFHRLVTDHEFEGTGVGLAIVHRLVTRHGGRVWAEGKPDEGATFYFSLPAKG